MAAAQMTGGILLLAITAKAGIRLGAALALFSFDVIPTKARIPFGAALALSSLDVISAKAGIHFDLRCSWSVLSVGEPELVTLHQQRTLPDGAKRQRKLWLLDRQNNNSKHDNTCAR